MEYSPLSISDSRRRRGRAPPPRGSVQPYGRRPPVAPPTTPPTVPPVLDRAADRAHRILDRAADRAGDALDRVVHGAGDRGGAPEVTSSTVSVTWSVTSSTVSVVSCTGWLTAGRVTPPPEPERGREPPRCEEPESFRRRTRRVALVPPPAAGASVPPSRATADDLAPAARPLARLELRGGRLALLLRPRDALTHARDERRRHRRGRTRGHGRGHVLRRPSRASSRRRRGRRRPAGRPGAHPEDGDHDHGGGRGLRAARRLIAEERQLLQLEQRKGNSPAIWPRRARASDGARGARCPRLRPTPRAGTAGNGRRGAPAGACRARRGGRPCSRGDDRLDPQARWTEASSSYSSVSRRLAEERALDSGAAHAHALADLA